MPTPDLVLLPGGSLVSGARRQGLPSGWACVAGDGVSDEIVVPGHEDEWAWLRESIATDHVDENFSRMARSAALYALIVKKLGEACVATREAGGTCKFECALPSRVVF